MKEAVNKMIVGQYLTPGSRQENFLFRECSEEFLEFAKQQLKSNTGAAKPCIIELDSKTESVLKRIYNQCTETERALFASYYFWTEAAIKVSEVTSKSSSARILDLDAIKALSKAFEENDLCCLKLRLNHMERTPSSFNVERFIKGCNDKIEFDIFLHDMNDQFLQATINSIAASRPTPYRLKIFTNQERLCTYKALDNRLIEDPHDYRDATSLLNPKRHTKDADSPEA